MDQADFGPTTQQLDSACEGLPPGTNLGGFRVVEVLGRGSSSIVYLALDSSLQRQVAIKEYLPADLAERGEGLLVSLKRGADAARFAEGVSAFLQRAKLLARLDCPALPRVHGFWQENRTAYMTMAYCGGQSLAAVLAEMPYPPDEAWLRALLAPLLDALELLHASQCTHSRISADNILVQADGSPVLLGLGAARRLTDHQSRPAGPWTDLNALARVLHLAIGGWAVGVARGALDHLPPSCVDTALDLQARFPGSKYSAAFLACVDAALSDNPRRRVTSVAEFRRRLDRVTRVPQGEAAPNGTTARPSQTAPIDAMPSMPSMAAQPARAKLLWAAALGLAVLGAAGGWWRVQMHAAPPPIARVSESLPAPAIEPQPAAVPASHAVQVPPVALPVPAEIATSVATSSSEAESVPDRKRTPRAEPNNPRAVCGLRTNFSLYYCMQTQCKRPQFLQHPQCVDLRQNDTVN